MADFTKIYMVFDAYLELTIDYQFKKGMPVLSDDPGSPDECEISKITAYRVARGVRYTPNKKTFVGQGATFDASSVEYYFTRIGRSFDIPSGTHWFDIIAESEEIQQDLLIDAGAY